MSFSGRTEEEREEREKEKRRRACDVFFFLSDRPRGSLSLSLSLAHLNLFSSSPSFPSSKLPPSIKTEYVKEAVAEDNAGNYSKALELYKVALEYFSTHLKYEKNPKAKEAITAKFKEYLERAEYLKGVVDGQTAEAAAPPPSAGGTGAQKAKTTTTPSSRGSCRLRS